MKKFSLVLVVLCIAFSCKKKSTTTPTPVTTTPQAVTSFSIDGVAITNLTHASFQSDSAHFGVIAYGASSIPELQIIFSGTVAPSYGTYQITSGSVTFAKCSFTLTDTNNYHSTALAGLVNVVTSGTAPNNVATFTNIAVGGSAGNHNISGTITY